MPHTYSLPLVYITYRYGQLGELTHVHIIFLHQLMCGTTFTLSLYAKCHLQHQDLLVPED